MNSIEIIDYIPEYAQAFKTLNEAWINRYFELEEEDIHTLGQPEKILEQGGYILVALRDNEPVGVCALRKKSPDTYEFSKMAVAESAQGLGIGRQLGEAAIARGRAIGARRIYLEGNTLLEASIHLYKKLGFKEIKAGPSVYKRVNIVMEMLL